ncbi:hypothetical protein FACS189472_14020 [Alphaproteobacteria bacterium]|nr:hypothetical protein FACS189472_14020 [Alphaproteobacteria bacterium]
MIKKYFILLFFAFGNVCSMLPTDEENRNQKHVSQPRRFRHNETVFELDKINRANDIIPVSLYFAQNIQKYIKPEFTVRFLEKKVLQPNAEGTVEMSIATLSTRSSSSSSSSASSNMALDITTMGKFENIFMPTSELQNLRNALDSRYNLEIRTIDCFSDHSKLYLYSVLEEVSLKIGKMIALSTKDSALSFPPPVCPEDKLTSNMIAIIAHQIIWTLPCDERKVYGPNVIYDLKYVIGQAGAKLRLELPQLMTAVILMKRLYALSCRQLEKNILPILGIRNDNIRLIFLGCLLLANKLMDDWAYFNTSWAQLFKVETDLINSTEDRILDALNFDLFISDETYDESKNALEKLWAPRVHSEKSSTKEKK